MKNIFRLFIVNQSHQRLVCWCWLSPWGTKNATGSCWYFCWCIIDFFSILTIYGHLSSYFGGDVYFQIVLVIKRLVCPIQDSYSINPLPLNALTWLGACIWLTGSEFLHFVSVVIGAIPKLKVVCFMWHWYFVRSITPM